MHINRLSGLLTLEHETYNCPWEKQSVFRSIPHYSNDVSLCPGRHLYSLCPGRHLCPGVQVCNFSLSVPVVIYIPCVPVVICVLVCNFYSNNPFVPVVIYISHLCPRRPRCSCVPVSRSSFILPVYRS